MIATDEMFGHPSWWVAVGILVWFVGANVIAIWFAERLDREARLRMSPRGGKVADMEPNTTTKNPTDRRGYHVRNQAFEPIVPRVIATDRDETDPCEAGTPGCCIDHRNDTGEGCDTW